MHQLVAKRKQCGSKNAPASIISPLLIYSLLSINIILVQGGGGGEETSSPASNMSSSASLDNLTKEQVIPDVIDSKPATSLSVEYDSGVQSQQGNELTPTQVREQPKFMWQTKPDKLYTLVMVDPDAPSRKDPKLGQILHFLVANIPGSNVTKGDTLAEYIGSGPPQGTGLHRYIFLVFEQQQGRLQSTIKISKTSRIGRKNFSIRNFAKDHQLGEPIAANFYQAQHSL